MAHLQAMMEFFISKKMLINFFMVVFFMCCVGCSLNTESDVEVSQYCFLTNDATYQIQCEVPIVALISNPEMYEGRLITTRSYVANVESRYYLVYDKKFFEDGGMFKPIVLNFEGSPSGDSLISEGYVHSITGVFSHKDMTIYMADVSVMPPVRDTLLNRSN